MHMLCTSTNLCAVFSTVQGAPRKKLPFIVPIRPTVRRMLSGGDDSISSGMQNSATAETRELDRTCLI